MGRTRSYRIRVRKRKIKKRQELIRTLYNYDDIQADDGSWYQREQDILSNKRGGYLAKNNLWSVGGSRKTKTKNTRVARHTKGNYGKAIIYSRHDKVQIVYMNQELKEYYNNEGEFSDDNTN